MNHESDFKYFMGKLAQFSSKQRPTRSNELFYIPALDFDISALGLTEWSWTELNLQLNWLLTANFVQGSAISDKFSWKSIPVSIKNQLEIVQTK